MIECVEGNIGSGKGMYCVDDFIRELRESDCFLTANEAFGLRLQRMSELHVERYGENFDLFERVRILSVRETMEFWRHPALNFDLNDTVEVPTLAGNGKERVTDFSLLHPDKGWKRCKIYIDEAPEFFDADSWEKISRDMKYFLRHSRKLQIDVVFICQDRSQLAKPLRVFFQQTTVCRNLGYEAFSLFSLPKRIYWRQYFKTPDVSARPMREGVRKIDAGWVGEMYDTAAGVAMTTGRKADTQHQSRGIPIYWLMALLFLAGLGLLLVPRLLGRLVMAGARPKVAVSRPVPALVPGASLPVAAVRPAAAPPAAMTATPSVPPRPPPELAATNDEGVAMTGYMRMPNGIWHVILSDGRVVLSTDPEFETLTTQGLKYAGHYYRRALAANTHPASTQSPAVTPPPVQSASFPYRLASGPTVVRRVNIHWPNGRVTQHTLTPSAPPPQDSAQENPHEDQ